MTPVIATTDKVVHDDNLGIDRRVFAGQPVPPDLVEAYEQAGGKTGEPEPVTSGQPVATATVVVRDDVLNIDRRVVAGQPVPPDLVGAYNDAVGAKDAVPTPDDEGTDYNSWSADDLEAEVERRGLQVEGTGANGNVVKADRVAALKANDAK